jgi:hypothetical protein
MKTFIIAALLSISAVATLGAPAFADSSLTVHGVFGGNSYGR